MRSLKIMLALVACLSVQAFAVPFAVEPFVAGKDYKVLDVPVPTESGDRVQVREFFSYTCPHCFSFDPLVHAWAVKQADDVMFIPTPGILNPAWEPLGRAFYVFESMGITEQVHGPFFAAIHVDKKPLTSKNNMAEFVTTLGFDGDEFIKRFSATATTIRVKKAQKLAANYQLTGVPMMTVAGKYVIGGRDAGSYERMLQIVDFLVARERAAK